LNARDREKNENTGKGETEEKNREARRNTKRNNTQSRGEKGQHTHRQGLIVPAIVLSLQKQKTKTTIGIHNKPASSLLFPSSSQNMLEEESRPRAQEQKKAKERRGGSRPARASPPSLSPRRPGKQLLFFN
jgi:hypothetical protein